MAIEFFHESPGIAGVPTINYADLAAFDSATSAFRPASGEYMHILVASKWARLSDAGALEEVVYRSLAQTLLNKTLTDPTIASFVNATHNHTNAAGGGQLTSAAISDFAEAVDDRVNPLTVGGVGISTTYNDGANTLTLDLDINELTTDNTPTEAADFIPYFDTGEGAPNKMTVAALLALATGTLDINGLSADMPVSGDFIPFYSVSLAANRKVDVDDLPGGGVGGSGVGDTLYLWSNYR